MTAQTMVRQNALLLLMSFQDAFFNKLSASTTLLAALAPLDLRWRGGMAQHRHHAGDISRTSETFVRLRSQHPEPFRSRNQQQWARPVDKGFSTAYAA